MSFTVFSNTVSDADLLMDNFYHVRYGDVYPMEGALFTATGLTGTLGTSTAVWKNAYCDKLIFDTTTSYTKRKIASAIGGTVSSVEITGLTKSSGFYEIRGYLTQEAGGGELLLLNINGVSGTSYDMHIGDAGILLNQRWFFLPFVNRGGFSILLSAKSDLNKKLFYKSACYSTTAMYTQTTLTCGKASITNTITSIKLHVGLDLFSDYNITVWSYE